MVHKQIVDFLQGQSQSRLNDENYSNNLAYNQGTWGAVSVLEPRLYGYVLACVGLGRKVFALPHYLQQSSSMFVTTHLEPPPPQPTNHQVAADLSLNDKLGSVIFQTILNSSLDRNNQLISRLNMVDVEFKMFWKPARSRRG
jgi:hypothetical protein